MVIMEAIIIIGMEIIIITIIIIMEAEEVLLTLQMEIEMVSEMVPEARISLAEETVLLQRREVEIPIIITQDLLQTIL